MKLDEIKKFAKDNFDRTFGKSTKEIEEMMNALSVSSSLLTSLEGIPLGTSEYTVVGSAALVMHQMLARAPHDIDILCDITHYDTIIAKLKQYLVRAPHDDGSRSFTLDDVDIEVEKFVLSSGKSLDVFFVSKKVKTIQFMFVDRVYNVETLPCILKAKRAYINSGDLDINSLKKQEQDLVYIENLLS